MQPHHIQDEREVLLPEWRIQSKFCAEQHKLIRSGILAERYQRGIAGQQPKRQKHQCEHQQQCRHGIGNSQHDITDHVTTALFSGQ